MKYSLSFLIGILALVFGCTAPDSPNSPASVLRGYFQAMEPGDTLFIGLDDGWDGDTIPAKVLWAELDSVLLEELSPGLDSAAMLFMANGSWMQDSTHQACLMSIEQSWWKFRVLLLYDQERQAFTRVEQVAMFYGGDGGQFASSSYLLDQDGDGDRDLVVRTCDHALRMQEDGEMEELINEGAYLRDWAVGGFRESPMPFDTATVVQALKVEWPW